MTSLQSLPRAVLVCFLCWGYLLESTSCQAQDTPLQGTDAPEATASLSSEALEFFERRVRPVLIEHCYECHNSAGTAEGDLALDWREPLRRGGQSGPVLGDDALLLKVIRHEVEGLEMPEGGPKLSDEVVADLEAWVRQGAPDPRAEPPSAEELAAATSWEAVRERRSQWWSFQPIRSPKTVPMESGTSGTAIDGFVRQQLKAKGLRTAPPAESAALLRRLSFVLTGLPPDPSQLEAFLADSAPGAYQRAVERLLDSPHFGERWARHWMDWVRYAESHGSEGDPRLVGAEHYRDYLIRALNADVPYDQLLMEHVAGDLLPEPRLDASLGINESVIGTAHWRMVFHGFAPTDALEEKVRFTDDALNVFSKAFLGLTVSCARCHDHKFDPISQADYYALYGVLASTRPGRAVIDTPERQQRHSDSLRQLRDRIQDVAIQDWLQCAHDSQAGLPAAELGQRVVSLLGRPAQDDRAEDPAELWNALQQEFHDYQSQLTAFQTQLASRRWHLGDAGDREQWYGYGEGARLGRRASASVLVTPDQPQMLQVLPKAFVSNSVSSKHAARLTSPDFALDEKLVLWLEVAGGGQAMARYVVQNYPRNGTVYPVTEFKSNRDADWHWIRFDLGYWQGDTVHIELCTAQDAPLLTKDVPRSWFGIRRAVVLPAESPTPPNADHEYLAAILAAQESNAAPPTSWDEWAKRLQAAIELALQALADGQASDGQAALLARCLKTGWLPTAPEQLPETGKLITEYRRLETQVETGTRVPSLDEWTGADSRLFLRGDHRQPQQLVPRRFLEVVDDTPYDSPVSGRLKLAEDLVRPDNPLPARVIVNRLWHHVFGRGLVSTPDNLGRLGNPPSHPELLDYLADRFRTVHHWSIKSMLREMVLSDTFCQASTPDEASVRVDPENIWLAHYPVRRLEAEAIRDAMLQASGMLDRQMFGPAVGGQSARRSVYVRVIRNDLDPFLNTFDAPVPFSTTGRRPQTNVPAQALLLMNNPQVRELAKAFGLAASVRAGEDESHMPAALDWMWRSAFGRSITAEESARGLAFLRAVEQEHASLKSRSQRLRERLAVLEEEIAGILEPAREKLQALRNDERSVLDAGLPAAAGEWLFDSLEDSVGTANLELKGTAKLVQGALVLDGQGWAESPPLRDLNKIQAKALEVLLELNGLQQRGGGAMSLQDLSGQTFDAIVFGERQPGHWLAGSNVFARTQDFGGSPEQQSGKVHFVLVYRPDGSVHAFRNGEPYGEPYRTQLQAFAGADSQLLFGLRHGKNAQGNRLLAGKLFEARLYDRALSDDEVRRVCDRALNRIGETEVLASLSPEQRSAVDSLREQHAQVQQEWEALSLPDHPTQAWTDLAHALFNMKEFVYVR